MALIYINRKEPRHLIFEWDTQSSSKGFHWEGENFFLTLGFKDVILESRSIGTKNLAVRGFRTEVVRFNSEQIYATLRCFAPLQHDKWCGLFHVGFSNNAKTLTTTGILR